jgi:hypothetical protein
LGSKKSGILTSCLEIFNLEILEAVYRTRILDDSQWHDSGIPTTILAENAFQMVRQPSRPMPPEYFILDIIRETTDYLVENESQTSNETQDEAYESKRLQIMRKLCEILVDQTTFIPSTYFGNVLRLQGTDMPLRRLVRSIQQNALPAAIALGMTSMVERLIRSGDDGVKLTYFGDAIDHAILCGDLRTVLLLLEAREQPHFRTRYTYDAAKLGHEGIVQTFLKLARTRSSEINDEMNTSDDEAMVTILDLCQDEGSDIYAGFIINLAHSEAESVLYESAIDGASSGGRLDLIKKLVQQAADQKLLVPATLSNDVHGEEDEWRKFDDNNDIYGWYFREKNGVVHRVWPMAHIISAAISHGHTNVVQFAIDRYKGSHNVLPKRNPLRLDIHIHRAVYNGHYDMVRLLLDHIDAKLISDLMHSLIQTAKAQRREKILRLLNKVYSKIKRHRSMAKYEGVATLFQVDYVDGDAGTAA